MSLATNDIWLPAEWPAPANVHAGTSLRCQVEKDNPYSSFNLASHVGDESNSVTANRKVLMQQLSLPTQPLWLRQVHGNDVINYPTGNNDNPQADGVYTTMPGQVCAILTADCIPLLLCNRQGNEIAAIHIGWRGLCKNIIHAALARFTDPASELLAWIGPHISQTHYEVGQEVIQACEQLAGDVSNFLTETRPAHARLDLGGLVKQLLLQTGMLEVYGANMCTYKNEQLFYSYRRTAITGRMASLIWI